MDFFDAFLSVSIALFTFTLLHAWLAMAVGRSPSAPSKLRGQIVLLLTGVAMYGVYGIASGLAHPRYALVPILLVVVLLSASRIGYEKEYDAQSFGRSSLIKGVIALIAAFFIS